MWLDGLERTPPGGLYDKDTIVYWFSERSRQPHRESPDSLRENPPAGKVSGLDTKDTDMSQSRKRGACC